MSSQTSNIDQIKDTAQFTYESITKTATSPSADSAEDNLTKVGQDHTCRKGDFQDQLSKAAERTASPQKEETYMEKVASLIPGLSKSQETKEQENMKSNAADGKKNDVRRPDHDVQIEEFMRTQYKSFKG